MKKLSIEEKTKAYDEALAKAVEIHRNYKGRVRAVDVVIEEVFPELKESEDERIIRMIRLAVEDHFSSEGIVYHEDMDNVRKEIYDWLEKQGEQKSIDDLTQQEAMDIAVAKCFEQGEQKLADKIEPKFKVGDWILIDNPCRITSIDNNKNYYVQYCDSETEYLLSRKFCEAHFHPWTIQDAKDGDVLHSIGWHNDCIFIFNGLDRWKFDESNGDRAVATGYCCLSVSADKMEFGIQGPDCIEVNTVKPATKEQRDLLFQKMKESGYEWNAEKKERKKIEQKQVINYPDSLPKDNWELIHEFVNKFGRIPKDEDELNVLIKYVLNRQKPAWSDDFEEEMDRYIEENFYGSDVNGFFSNRTKRELDVEDVVRIGCHFAAWQKEQSDKELSYKSKQEWSEEDETIAKALTKAINDNVLYGYIGKSKLLEWLKSLKDRYTWNPSDEQIIALRWILNNIPYNKHKEEINGLLEQLKKLREE